MPVRAAGGPPASVRWLVWAAASGVLLLPLAWTGRAALFGNTDALFYTTMLDHVAGELASARIWPRWFADANRGYGSAAGLFYAPFASVLTTLAALPLAPWHPGVQTRFLIGIAASQVACGVTAWLWLRRSFAPGIALAGSALYIALPYKLIYIYLHINLAQLWALAFLPLWTIAADRIARSGDASHKDAVAVGCYALALAATYLTHPLTVLAFGAIPAAYVLWFGSGRGRACRYGRLAAAHGLGLGICAVQLLWQRGRVDWISPDLFLAGRSGWQANLGHVDVVLCTAYGVVAVLVGYAAWRPGVLSSRELASRALFWCTCIAVTVFMTQPVSAPIWRALPPLQFLQFPAARLHAGALVGVTYLLCIWLSEARRMRPLGPMAYRLATLGCLLAASGALVGWRLASVMAASAPIPTVELEAARAARLVTPPEYRTAWGCIDNVAALAVEENQVQRAVVTWGEAALTVLAWAPPDQVVVRADVAAPSATIAVRQCYLPTWRARDGTGDIAVRPAEGTGVATFDVAPGTHTVVLTMPLDAAEIAARIVAVVCLFAALGLTACGVGRRAWLRGALR